MRRRFKSKTGFPLTKATGDIARNRGFQKPSEMRKAKRVRFDDAETDASSRGHEPTQSPRCGSPKTSEYAYFRKVKNGAVNGRALHKESEQLKSSKINYLLRGESAGPSSHKLFVSPPIGRYHESTEIRSKELTHKTKQRSPLLTETATLVGQSLFSSPLNQATKKSENQCIENGIFTEKRKRLRQWVALTTSSEVEKLHEKGSDLVSFLLCRLVPKGNENNDSSKENADNSCKSLTVHESDNVDKGLPLSHKRDHHKELPKFSSERSSEIVLREWDSFDSEFPSNYHKEDDHQKTMDGSGRSNEIVIRERDSFHSGLSSNYHKESDLQSNSIDPDQLSKSHICNGSETQHGLSFCIPFESFRSLGAFHFKDLDEFGPIIGHGREEPYRNSLKWDFEFGNDRVFHGTNQDVRHRTANTWNFDQQEIVDNVVDNKGFYRSPLFPSSSLFKPLPKYVSTGCVMREVQPKFDDMKYAMVEPGTFSVSFPCSPECIPLAEDKNAENFLSNGNIILSYRDPRRPKKVWDCTPHSDFWYKGLSSSEVFAEDHHPSGFHAWQFPRDEKDSYSLSLLKEAPEESLTSFYEGAFDHYLLSSTLHSPVDTFMNCPLLLNHVSQDILDQELYCDDYDNELGYRKMV